MFENILLIICILLAVALVVAGIMIYFILTQSGYDRFALLDRLSKVYPYNQDISLSCPEGHVLTFSLDKSKGVVIRTREGTEITGWLWFPTLEVYRKDDQCITLDDSGIRWIRGNEVFEFVLPLNPLRSLQLVKLSHRL